MNHSVSSPHLVRINIILAIAAVLSLGYYVVQVNALAAQTWQTRTLNERLSALQDERNTLVSERAAFDDRQSLAQAADHAGLVPASHVVYLVQDHSVAAAR